MTWRIDSIQTTTYLASAAEVVVLALKGTTGIAGLASTALRGGIGGCLKGLDLLLQAGNRLVVAVDVGVVVGLVLLQRRHPGRQLRLAPLTCGGVRGSGKIGLELGNARLQRGDRLVWRIDASGRWTGTGRRRRLEFRHPRLQGGHQSFLVASAGAFRHDAFRLGPLAGPVGSRRQRRRLELANAAGRGNGSQLEFGHQLLELLGTFGGGLGDRHHFLVVGFQFGQAGPRHRQLGRRVCHLLARLIQNVLEAGAHLLAQAADRVSPAAPVHPAVVMIARVADSRVWGVGQRKRTCAIFF